MLRAQVDRREKSAPKRWSIQTASVLPLLLLGAIVGLGLYFRVLAVYRGPFYEDDYASGLQVLGILRTGRPQLPSGLVQWAEPVALPYMVSVLWRLTGPDILLAKLLIVIVGTVTILMGFFLGRRLRGVEVGLVFALLLSTHVWNVASSAYFRHYAPGELGLLVIAYFSVWWLRSDRSLARYAQLLGVTTASALVGHYLLLLLFPVVAVLPLLAKVADVVQARITIPRPVGGSTPRWGPLVRLRIDGPLLVALAGAVFAGGIFLWLTLRQGTLLVNAIGSVTKEFFTVLPRDPKITFHRFFLDSLVGLYGWTGLLLIGAGAIVVVGQMGREGFTFWMLFAVPFVLLSTVFASLTVTNMYDRYLFPFHPVLLLAIASLLGWAAGGGAMWIGRMVPAARRRASLVSSVLLAGMVVAVVARTPAFLMRFDPVRTPDVLSRWVRARAEPRSPPYRRVAAYLKGSLGPGEPVLRTRTLDSAFEFPGVRGYWLMHNPHELRVTGVVREGKLVDRYAGYSAITNLGELLDLVRQNPRGWLVLPYFHDNVHTLSQPAWDFIHQLLVRTVPPSDETISLLRWQPGFFRVIPLRQPLRSYGNAFAVERRESDSILFRGRAGEVNWAGVEFRPLPLFSTRDTALAIRLAIETAGGRGVVRFDVILEEIDGDRWHVAGLLPVTAGSGWHEFYLPFTRLDFWPLGKGTREPDRIAALKVEAADAKNLSFVARLRVMLVTRPLVR